MKVLTIISGVFIDTNKLKTVNSSFDEIILAYTDFWDKIHLIGPTKDSKDIIKVKSQISEKILLTSISKYNKTLTSRISLILFEYEKIISNYLNETGILNESDCIQLRYPNFFVLMLAFGLKSYKLKSFFYIAGNEVELTKINYWYLYPFAKLKQLVENYTMKGKPIVTTGDTLAKILKPVGKVHPFYSTTHKDYIKRQPKKHYQKCLYVGSIYKAKRAIDLVKAIELLKDDYPNVKCTIIGTGNKFQELKEYINKHYLNKHITLTGYISSRDLLKSYYRNSDFLILPSLSEGTPRVLPEAMAQGVIPLAAKRVSSNEYIIKPYVNGSLFEKKSPKSIAVELKKYFDDRKLYERNLTGIYDYAKKHTLPKELEKMWRFVFQELNC